MSKGENVFVGMSKRKSVSKKKLVFVAMSGGVDSSVAALLLKKKGYDVIGVFMRCLGSDNGPSTSLDAARDKSLGVNCAETDAEDARRVAGKLGIPFYVWDFEEEYKKKVVDYMVDGYRRGLTPNPDVMCNKEIKFGLFLEKALKFGADYVATGHYVRIKEKNGRFSLYAAKDKNKDQSYFLWTLNQEQLKHCLFPIGDYLKPEVRAIAKKAGLPTAEKKDSQGICFLGKVTLSDFLRNYLPVKKGVVLNVSGEKIGKHSGAHFYTIGQRHGLYSGDWKRTDEGNKPFYVSGKNVRNNTLVVAEGESDESLFREEVGLTDLNFINQITDDKLPISVFARVRYRQPLFRASLEFEKGRELKLVFDKPQKFVAAGQSAVFYVPAKALTTAGSKSSSSFAEATEDMEVLGGGVIK